jgi:hypothetical protein
LGITKFKKTRKLAVILVIKFSLQNLKTRKLAVIYWLKIKLVKELK